MDVSQAEAATVAELRAIARQFAAYLRPGMRIGLQGSLGAGKTTFVKELARVLGVQEDVLSPTYLYHQSYPAMLPAGTPITLHHLDFYRLRSGVDVAALDLRVEDPDGVVLIEWVDRVPEVAQDVDVRISFVATDGIRLLTFDWSKK